MPIYEYQCDACGHRFERHQRMSADPVTDCPDCQEPDVRRLISASSFQLKGSGWYVTDYARKSSPNKSSANKSSAASDG